MEEHNDRVVQYNLIFALDFSKKTADVVGNVHAHGDIFIPRLLIHESQVFIIKRIEEGTFKNSTEIKSIDFPNDSEITYIRKDAFDCSTNIFYGLDLKFYKFVIILNNIIV